MSFALRTKDDLQLQLDFQVTFQIVNLDCLLEMTKDPIQDLQQMLRSQVIQIVGRRSLEGLQTSWDVLSTTASFPAVSAAAHDIGIVVKDIACAGYSMSEVLNKIHSKAVEERTSLQMKLEAAQQEQHLEDLRLSSELERAVKQHEMEELKQRHAAELGVAAHLHDLDCRRSAAEQAHEVERARNDEELRYLKELGSQGVDVTAYLVSKNSSKHDRF